MLRPHAMTSDASTRAAVWATSSLKMPTFSSLNKPHMSMLRRLVAAMVLLLFAARSSTSQDTPPKIIVEVHADQPDGPMIPIWNYFGYDEPNYTYSPNGKKLLGELAALSPVPVYVRVHNLFTTGDGSASLSGVPQMFTRK